MKHQYSNEDDLRRSVESFVTFYESVTLTSDGMDINRCLSPSVSSLDPVLIYTGHLSRIYAKGIRKDWDRVLWSIAARNLQLLSSLVSVLDVLKEEGIPVVLLKGMHLARDLYPHIGLRSMADIDLLVHWDDAPKTDQLLRQQGFVRREGGNDVWELSSKMVDEGLLEEDPDYKHRWIAGEVAYQGPNGVGIDLHCHLIPSIWLRRLYSVDLASVWDQTMFTHIAKGEEPIRVLSPVVNIAYLCLHLAQHGLQPLRSILDIDMFIRRNSVLQGWDWKDLVNLAERWKLRSIIYHTLTFSRSLFGTPIPEDVLAQLYPGRFAESRVKALIRPQDLVIRPRTRLGVTYPALVKVALIDRVSGLGKVAADIFWPDIRWRHWRYGSDSTIVEHWKHAYIVVKRGD